MIKECKNCGESYWARWRNEPVQLCPDCRLGVVVCATCGELVTGPADPDQLSLFTELGTVATSRTDMPSHEERYWSLRAKASQATRRRYPYC